ncbi:MAG: DUF4041 domain-containing protein [Proteobacteria bacterium]|nr:DUF4041 domain-containing protein [Pseudomonadota bacterium]
MKSCSNCHAELPDDARFCASCGSPLPTESPQEEATRLEDKIKRLRAELESVEDAVEIQSYGFYEPRYGLETSAEYAERLKEVREKQKQLIRTKKAIFSPKDWIVDGSLAKGRKMMTEQSQLMLRAFNGDCDATVSRTKFDNVEKLEKRIRKAFESINKLGATKKIAVTEGYLNEKLAELHLVHEHREKLYQEKEEQRAIKEQLREEQVAEKEIEKARRDAEKEEEKHKKALEKAREKLDEATGAQLEKLQVLVQKLETELADAIDRKAKSIARAQLTRSGHVYVLSNVGSFGEGVYKIGMTRRFEPLERVYELGDSSVPFRFDVHAMIYTEDAPQLENMLHKEFDNRRVNMINLRREYFRVTLEEIQAAVAKYHKPVTFVTTHAAEEYRRSVAIHERRDSCVGD